MNPSDTNRIQELEQFKEQAEPRIERLEMMVKSLMSSVDDLERAQRKSIYTAQKVENIEGTLNQIVPNIGKILGKDKK